MKLFLYGLLELIKKGESETTVYVEEKIKGGIATTLYRKYSDVFNSVAFSVDSLKTVDEYFLKKYMGVADGLEHKYSCDENDGLYLIIKLGLEGI